MELTAVGLGLVLGFLIGLTGVGGGALVAPALYTALGLPYGEAVAVSLVYSLFAKVVSAIQHVKQGTVLWKITLLYGLAGIPGAVLGSRLVYVLGASSGRKLPFVMSGVLLFVAALLMLEEPVQRLVAWEKPLSPHQINWVTAGLIGGFQLGVGALMGMTSVGSGSLVILSMLYLFRMSAREIVGSNIVIALIMVLPAGLTHYAAGGLNWRLVGPLVLGSVGGAVLGARSAMRVPDRPLKLAMAVLILAGALATVVKAW